MCTNYVAYYRVSTAKQGKSGLGMEAQRDAAAAFIVSKGRDAKLLSAFTEVESGKKSERERPELLKAMERAKLTGSTLLIAKLDRLSRDVHFLTGLQKAGVQFIAVDMPEANEMVVQLMAVVAQGELKMTSARTKAALAVARKRVEEKGQRKNPAIKRLGNPNGAAHLRKFGNAGGVAKVRANADANALALSATIAQLQAEGITSANAIARALNERHYSTPRAGTWTARSVLNVLARLSRPAA